MFLISVKGKSGFSLLVRLDAIEDRFDLFARLLGDAGGRALQFYEHLMLYLQLVLELGNLGLQFAVFSVELDNLSGQFFDVRDRAGDLLFKLGK